MATYSEDLLEAHRPECKGIGQTAVTGGDAPEEGKNKFTFQNHHKQLPAPYVSSTPTSKPSPRKSKDQSSTPKKAIPRGHGTPRDMQLLLCQGAVRRADRGACRIPGARRSRTLPPSSRLGGAWDKKGAVEPPSHENDPSRLGDPQNRAQMPCVWRPPGRRLCQGPLPHHR